uniref:Uncharacterized protein n=1 Tax=Anopheles melas TaxID=34690 RepID=A0A182U3M4_9DIPT
MQHAGEEIILLQLFDKLGQLVWQGGFASVPVTARADYADALRQILLHTARASHAHHVAATEPADHAHHAAHAAAHRHGVHWAAHTDDAHYSDHVTGARTRHADVAQATPHANHVARLVARVHVVVQHYVARLHRHGRMGRNVVRRRLRTRRHGRLRPRRRYRPRGRLGLRAANRWRRPDRLHQLLLHRELLRVRRPHDALVRALALLLLLELLGKDVHADAALCLRVRLHRLLNVLLLVGEHAATLPVPAAHLLLRPGTLVVRWDGWNVTAGHGQLPVQHQLLLLLLLLLRLLLLVPELLLQLQPCCFVCCTTRFIFWQDGRRQLASRHWQACTSDWMQRWIDCLRASCGFVCFTSDGDDPSSRSKPSLSILCWWPTFSLQPLRLRYPLLGRMAVEDVVVALGRRAGPDVGHRVAELLRVVHVAEQYLVVDGRAVLARPEEVHRVETRRVFGAAHSDPYSCTCMPKKHTSTPSTSSNANSAFARYGNSGSISPFSTNRLRMPGFTSTILSELETTRMCTSPAPASFFFRKLFTRVSMYVPSLEVGRRFALNLLSFRFWPFFFRQASHTNPPGQIDSR